MICFVDCETSGLLRDDLPIDAPEQPHMVQLAAHLYDQQRRERGRASFLIKPAGWEIEPQAAAVHGISTDDCARYGVPLAVALIALQGLCGAASRVVAHNLQFDRKVITASIIRAGGQGTWWAKAVMKGLCTMEVSTPVLKLPGEFGYKFPSLAEATLALRGVTLEQQHDADADIDATALVYWTLLDRGVIREADPFAEALARTRRMA